MGYSSDAAALMAIHKALERSDAAALVAILEALEREGIGVGLAPRMVLQDGKPTLTFIARLQFPPKPSNSANAAVS
jgi:hypothetical protein